jgi:hypothetical protein
MFYHETFIRVNTNRCRRFDSQRLERRHLAGTCNETMRQQRLERRHPAGTWSENMRQQGLERRHPAGHRGIQNLKFGKLRAPQDAGAPVKRIAPAAAVAFLRQSLIPL